MRIERLTVREIELPLRAPFVTTFGAIHSRRLLLVELEDGDGTPGWAECVAGAVPGYTAETVDSAWATITEQLGPEAVGLEVEDPSGSIAAIGDLVPDQPMARAAVEMACWDLAARREHLPLVELLGGTRTAVPAGIALGMAATHEETVEAAVLAVGQGYQRIKLKIQPGTDVELVRAVRERVGDQVALTVDANGSYSRDDFDHLAALDEFQLQMIEQPLPADDLEGHADLQPTPGDAAVPRRVDRDGSRPGPHDRSAGRASNQPETGSRWRLHHVTDPARSGRGQRYRSLGGGHARNRNRARPQRGPGRAGCVRTSQVI